MSCCVPLCTFTRKKRHGQSFHEFPSDETQRQAWLKAIGRKDFVPNDKSNSSVVCSVHFQNSDFKQGLKCRRLKAEAVPSIFLGYPDYLQPPQPKESRTLVRRQPEPKTTHGDEVHNSLQHISRVACQYESTAQLGLSTTEDNCSRQDPREEAVIPPVIMPAVEEKPAESMSSVGMLTVSQDEREIPASTATASATQASGEEKAAQNTSSVGMLTLSQDEREIPVCTIAASATQASGDWLSRRRRDALEINRLKANVYRRNKIIQRLQEENDMLREALDAFEKDPAHSALHKCLQVQKACTGRFSLQDCLIEQLGNSLRAKPMWSPKFVRECLTLHYMSPKAYNHIRKRGFLKLPSKNTIIRYFHTSERERRLERLMEDHLKDQSKSLKDEEELRTVGNDETEHLEGQEGPCLVAVDKAQHLKDQGTPCSVVVNGVIDSKDQERLCTVVVDEGKHLEAQGRFFSVVDDEGDHLEGHHTILGSG